MVNILDMVISSIEASRLTGIHRTTINQHARMGTFLARHADRSWFIDKQSFLDAVAQGKVRQQTLKKEQNVRNMSASCQEVNPNL